MTGQQLEQASADSFPGEAFGALVRRLPRYARLAWALSREPRLSRARRAAVLVGAAYAISPIDLVPGFIPVLGQLDDVVVAMGGIRLALNGLSPELRAEKLAAADLTQADLDADLRTTGKVAAWLGRSGLRVGFRFGRGAVDAGRRFISRRRGG